MNYNILIPHSALQDDLWRDSDLAQIYLFLISNIDAEGVATVSRYDIAYQTGLAIQAVDTGLDKLERTHRIIRRPKKIKVIGTGIVGGISANCATRAKDKHQENFEWFQEYFNGMVAGSPIPRITKLTASRKNALRSIFKEYGRETVETVIKKTIDSNFLSKDWGRAGFDWIFKKANFIKILEGNYDNKTRQTPATDKYSARRGTDVGNHTEADYGGPF